jgi:hypothetical protein
MRPGIFTDLHNPHRMSAQASAPNTWRDRLQIDADESRVGKGDFS